LPHSRGARAFGRRRGFEPTGARFKQEKIKKEKIDKKG